MYFSSNDDCGLFDGETEENVAFRIKNFDDGTYSLSMNWVKMVRWVDSASLAPMI